MSSASVPKASTLSELAREYKETTGSEPSLETLHQLVRLLHFGPDAEKPAPPAPQPVPSPQPEAPQPAQAPASSKPEAKLPKPAIDEDALDTLTYRFAKSLCPDSGALKALVDENAKTLLRKVLLDRAPDLVRISAEALASAESQIAALCAKTP
jgi:hypothetical protein